TLKDPRGGVTGQGSSRTEGSADAWRAGDPVLMKSLAQAGAPSIAQLVQDEAPVPVAEVKKPPVMVRQVTGAPGDGQRSLTRAVIEALRRLDLVASAAGQAQPKDALIVAGTVDVVPAATGKQKVTVTWEVSRADGQSLGKVAQEN